MMLETRAVACATPIVTSRGALNDRNCHLTMPVGKGLCAYDVLLFTFNVGMFKCDKNNFTTIEHICTESASLIECHNVAFNTNDWWNPFETVPLIGMEGMVTRVCFRYTRDYLTSGINIPFKSAGIEKLMSLTTKINAVLLLWYMIISLCLGSLDNDSRSLLSLVYTVYRCSLHRNGQRHSTSFWQLCSMVAVSRYCLTSVGTLILENSGLFHKGS